MSRGIRGLVCTLILVAGASCAAVGPNVRAKFDKATALVRTDDKNKFDEAERLFDEVIAADPKNEDAVYWKAQLLMAWSDALFEESVNLAKAEKKLADLLERAKAKVEKKKDPEFKKLAQATADRAGEMHRFIAETLAKWKTDAARHQKRGLDLVKAEIEGKPNPPYAAHRVLADYYRIKGDHDLARKELEAVRTLNPDSAGLRFVNGVLLMKVDNDLDGAIKSMDEALAIDGQFIKALYYKGLALAKKDDKEEAEKIMRAVLEKSPGHQGASNYLQVADHVRKTTADLEK